MKTIALACLLLAGVAHALPPGASVHIEKIEGVVVEIPDTKAKGMVSVVLKVTFTSDPEKTKDLYSTIRRKTRYPIQDLSRPKKDEVILVFSTWGESLPKGITIGDRLRVTGYGLWGTEESSSPAHTSPGFSSIELNPKG